MSFKQIDFNEIAKEKWSDSVFYNDVVDRKYFFVAFKEDDLGVKSLYKVFFWNMPYGMRLKAKRFWIDTRNKVIKRNFDSFLKISDKQDFHIRPKARNAQDTTTLNDGTVTKKMAYWINQSTLDEIVQGAL